MFKRNLGERGIAHLAIIVLVALLAVGGAGFYVFKQQQSKPDNKAVAEAFKKLECKIEDKDICKLYTASLAVKDLTLTLELPDDAQGTGTYQKSGDNYRLASKATDSQESYEMVTFEGTTYVKDPADGKWWTMPSSYEGNNSVEPIFNEIVMDDPATDKTKYKKLGKEKCGSLTCFKYEMTTEDDTVSTIWFDARNYLLRKITSNQDGQTTTATFGYDTPAIKKPSPIKEYPSTDSLNGMSTEELQQLMEQYMQQAQ